ncbi:MAG: hypothetical protein J6W12_01035 [Bacteroidales bacterium]|nr:hypothetical protein [Bacteroidales bacterium]
MKKNLSTGRIMRLAMALLLLTIGGISTTLHAQRNDGFFRSNNNDDVYNDRDASTLINGGGFTNNQMNQQDPNSPAPIGSGLLIMVAAGAGYAVARRKKAVRKSAALLMAGVLMLGLTQCRKKDVATVVDNTANLVPMTLTTDGAKTSFDDGVISWVSGDKLNVVAGGKCIGTLTYDGNDFSGYVDLDAFSESDETTFYFYYVGNQTIGSGETSFTMSMSGQTGAKANLGDFHVSKGLQYVIINKSGMNVSATLRSYTSVAYFNVSGFNRYSETDENLYMYGDNIYEQLTINFSDNSITPEHDGYYISAGTSADKANAYYMFIPTSADGQTEVNHVVNFVNKRTSATTTFKYGIVSNGWYCNGGFDEPIAVTGAEYYQGTLRGEFSVVANNSKKVKFSQGNLQYLASETKWKFANNQYDYIGNAPGNNTASANRPTQNYWIVIFSWGTSGYNNTANDEYATRYQPYLETLSSTVNVDYNYYGYGPSTNMTDVSLIETSKNYDWGIFNAINNGGNTTNIWRTLTLDNKAGEWYCLIGLDSKPSPGTNCRTVINTLGEDYRYTQATIGEDLKGLVLFPDNYTHPNGTTITNAVYNSKSDFTAVISQIEWNMMEAAGAVFLPTAGYRTSGVTIWNSGSQGRYWSVNRYDIKQARGIQFNSYGVSASYYYTYNGTSVRLVKDVE